jgi:hypothetical protein
MKTMLALTLAGIHHDITLRWIKAHADHLGNVRADCLARQGAAMDVPPVEDAPGMTWAHKKDTIRCKMREHWSNRWVQRADCRQTKLWFPQLNGRMVFDNLRLNRHQFSSMVHIITGHGFLNYHNALVEGSTDPDEALCRRCVEEDETSFHVIAECPAFCVARASVFRNPVLHAPLSCSHSKIASFLREASIGSLWELIGEEQ